MMTQIVIFDGFDEMDAIAPFEALQTAAADGADVRAELVTLDEAQTVTAAHGLRVRPHGRLSLERKPQVLIVPGGGWNNPSATQGARQEARRGDLPRRIARLHQEGTLVAGVCTGTMLIAAAGLLNGRPAVTHHAAIEDLRASGAEIIHSRVVDDGDIITSGGVSSGLDLGLWLLERFIHPCVAQQVEMRMEYERRGTVWRRTTHSTEI